MLRFLTFIIFLSSLYGIVPPKDGKLSPQIIENLKNQNIGNFYGDPGWVSKISNSRNEPGRNTQLEFFMPVILGKYEIMKIIRGGFIFLNYQKRKLQ